MAANVDKYIHEGYRKFQLKVGGNPRDDIDRIRAVRKLLDDRVSNRYILLAFHFYYMLLSPYIEPLRT